MGSSYSGLFPHTFGSKKEGKHTKNYHKKLKLDLLNWLTEYKKTLSKKEEKEITVACIVLDSLTSKEYYGINKGIFKNNDPKNEILFGSENNEGLLPKESLNNFPIANCAEVDAVNKALNDGALLKNLYMKTISATKNNIGKNKKACENCTKTFKGNIKKNYSGWEE